MPKAEAERPLTQSVLDRLIDVDGKNSVELPVTRSESERQFRKGLRRDLEWLLNTRRIAVELPADSPLRKSVFYFGLPDFTLLNTRTSQGQSRLARELEALIAIFEPRLVNVRVSIPDTVGSLVRFHIDAVLLIDPAPERVTFDSSFERFNGEYRVHGDGSAR